MITDLWKKPAEIAPNHFVFKALSCWSLNVAVGCAHACRFCYVPSASTNKLVHLLKPLGVSDPDEKWGEYAFPRPFDEKVFRASLRRAESTPEAELNPDGNRAVMLSTTTDPYMVIPAKDLPERQLVNEQLKLTVRKALQLIRDESTLNVRILTRGPLAVRDFDLMKTFGPRLMFGMSIPTLDDKIARIYEPHAPAPSKRMECLRLAKVAGLHIFVAMAPTYPECDAEDIFRTLKAFAEIEPMTIFHEPINIRAENVARIEAHAREIEVNVRTEVFKSKMAWAQYAREQLSAVDLAASQMGLKAHLHSWPDKSLPAHFQDPKFTAWCKAAWARRSEWPQVPTPEAIHKQKLHEFDDLEPIIDGQPNK